MHSWGFKFVGMGNLRKPVTGPPRTFKVVKNKNYENIGLKL